MLRVMSGKVSCVHTDNENPFLKVVRYMKKVLFVIQIVLGLLCLAGNVLADEAKVGPEIGIIKPDDKSAGKPDDNNFCISSDNNTVCELIIELNHTLTLAIKNVDAWQKQDPTHLDLNKLTLYLDGVALKSLKPAFTKNNTQISFSLEYLPSANNNADNQQIWKQLLKQKRNYFFSRPVNVSLGYDGIQFASSVNATLTIVDKTWFYWFLAISGLLIVFFIWLTISSDVIREPGLQPNGSRKPFSLSRFQMAVWFFVVLISYVFIWIVTSDLANLTPSVLGLIGISAATGLGAMALDSSKSADQDKLLNDLTISLNQYLVNQQILTSEIAQITSAINVIPAPANLTDLQTSLATKTGELAGKQQQILHANNQIRALQDAALPEKSQGFIKDILHDDGGVSFHRFQIFSWTITLIIIFISKVSSDLNMPDFDSNLLALMGISSGTYLGFKLPNTQG